MMLKECAKTKGCSKCIVH